MAKGNQGGNDGHNKGGDQGIHRPIRDGNFQKKEYERIQERRDDSHKGVRDTVPPPDKRPKDRG